MTEELKVVLKRSEHSGFGFSLLGTTGPPHVIYDIVENSPAADCGVVEAGDIILKVNGTDVHRYTTKEVLKCLRLSDDSVTLELKRDPILKAHIKEKLANTKSPHYIDIETKNSYDYHQQHSKIASPTNSQGSGGGGGSGSGFETSPAHQRYKSPTHLPQRHSTATSTTSGHSRNSSNSSAHIYLGNDPSGTTTNTAGTNNTQGNTTSSGNNTPTLCRPSRIPALKQSPKHPPVLHSPQHKRPKPSQIPTKASNGKPAVVASRPTNNAAANPLQHSNSYSGSTNRYTSPTHKANDILKEPEPNSAPPQPTKAPRFEAYMMTGELILNLSRTPQSSNLLTAHAKKVDSLRDSPNRTPPNTVRANGALAPKASGESSPTSSSSVDSPSHSANSANSLQQQGKSKLTKGSHYQQKQEDKENLSEQQHRDSVNNSYNNSQSVGGGGLDRQYRKDSITNDTLQLCEELERDDDDGIPDNLNELVENSIAEEMRRKKLSQLQRKKQRQNLNKTDKQHHHHHPHAKQPKYDYYRNEDENHYQRSQDYHQDDDFDEEDNDDVDNEGDDDLIDEDDEDLENEEDQTNYDITNIETYNSGGSGCMGADDTSDRQCLVSGDDEDEAEAEDDEEYSINSMAKTSAAQRLKALKQKSVGKYKNRSHVKGCDSVDCATRRHHHHHLQKQTQHSGSSSSSNTVRSEAICGTNTSQDETSFSVPSSPISLSTPLLDKETANSVPTSPEPSNLGAVGGGGGSGGNNSNGSRSTQDSNHVIRRHNGHIVRKCDSAGFRTSKSEDHLQQIQREGTAVIPIDIDEDVNSSLNTLLDTRHDSEDSQASNRDRIVWTYNAPLSQLQQQQLLQQQQSQQYSNNYVHHHHHHQQHQHHSQQQTATTTTATGTTSQHNSHSSSISSSPQHSVGSPASPTSVSSSVMSSSGSKGALGVMLAGGNGHLQQFHQHQQQTNLGNNQQNGGSNGAGVMATNGSLQYGQVNNGSSNNGYGNNTLTTGLNANSNYNGNSGNGGMAYSAGGAAYSGGGDHSVSEAISNISSPDYQDDDNLLSSRDILGGMLVSDPSDSDSTILVSDTAALQRQQQRKQHEKLKNQQQQSEHKLVIQVRGLDSNSTSPRSISTEHKDSEDDVATLTDEQQTTILSAGGGGFNNLNSENRDSSPPVSDDGSDVESLHSYHYSPKAVDLPSAIRLAKRLYSLDGFKKSDVSRHLSKNNDFSRAVADEYLKYFNFEKKSLDQALREFLQQFSLSGETQERERVLVHFSKRYLDCNPGAFNSQDAVHTLTCAIMLLNTDLHGPNIGRKMSCAEFIDNLSELNDGENFPKDVLKHLYAAIKSHPLEWALDDDGTDVLKLRDNLTNNSTLGQNPFLDIPESSTAVEYKKGYVMRKCCYDANYKKTPFGKRSWKMFYCTLRDLVLFLHKDEHGFRKSQMSDNLHNAIRIHHALATKACDYMKKQHVFRLQTADQAEYLFQTSDSKELQSWIDTINFVCAAYSAPPLEAGVGSQKRFQRPLLPGAHTKLLMKEQLEAHEMQVSQLERELNDHKRIPIPSKGLPLQNYKEKESYLQYELRRYKVYASLLSAKILAEQQSDNPLHSSTNDEETDTFPTLGSSTGPRLQPTITNNIGIGGSQVTQLPASPQLPTNQQSSNRKRDKKK